MADSSPRGASKGNLYVTDTYNYRIQMFSPDGVPLRQVGGLFNQPRDIALDAAGDVYVAEYRSHRIVKMSPAGEVKAEFGTRMSDPDQVLTAAGSQGRSRWKCVGR